MPYDPRYHQRTGNLEDEIGGYAGYEEAAVKPQRTHRPASHLRNTEQAIIAERLARQQAIDEARGTSDMSRAGNLRGNTCIPDAHPKIQQKAARREEDELYEDEELSTRFPRSAVRYTPEEIYQSGNTRLHYQEVVVPKKRRSSQENLPPGRAGQLQPRQTWQEPRQTRTHQEIYTEDIDEQETERPSPRNAHRRNMHINPLVWLGFGMIVMIFLWILGNYAMNWWQIHQDDSTYGRPRTFQVEAVVGHNDSTSNPSHFIAVNLNRHVMVIEIPGGDPTKARIYPVTTLYGDGQDLTPVTISFKDVDGDGLVDMEVHIQDQTLVMINENGVFRPLKPGEKYHL